MFKRILVTLLLIQLSTWVLAAELLDKVVAVVNDDVITERELDEQVDLLKQQLLAKKMALPENAVLKKQVLQHLIDVNLQLQLAKSNDITVDSSELDETIAKIAKDNKFSLSELREMVQKQGFTWNSYRENVRKELIVNRVQQRSVGKNIVVSSQQVEDYLSTFLTNQKLQQTYNVQNIVIPLSEEPTSEQVGKAKEKALELLKKIKQGEDFSRIAITESSGEFALEGGDLGNRHLAELPEVFAKQVEAMEVGAVSGPIRTGNGFQLIKLVAIANDDSHHQVTKTHVRHILMKPGLNRTEASATEQITNIYQQLKAGKDFAYMAKQYSLDSASAVKGGDLGWVTADELVPQFAKAMNQLPLHTVSKPVKSPFGWHIIEVLERKTEDDSKTYQRQQVRQLLQQRKFTEAVQNWQQHMRSSAYVNILDKELA